MYDLTKMDSKWIQNGDTWSTRCYKLRRWSTSRFQEKPGCRERAWSGNDSIQRRLVQTSWFQTSLHGYFFKSPSPSKSNNFSTCWWCLNLTAQHRLFTDILHVTARVLRYTEHMIKPKYQKVNVDQVKILAMLPQMLTKEQCCWSRSKSLFGLNRNHCFLGWFWRPHLIPKTGVSRYVSCCQTDTLCGSKWPHGDWKGYSITLLEASVAPLMRCQWFNARITVLKYLADMFLLILFALYTIRTFFIQFVSVLDLVLPPTQVWGTPKREPGGKPGNLPEAFGCRDLDGDFFPPGPGVGVLLVFWRGVFELS